MEAATWVQFLTEAVYNLFVLMPLTKFKSISSLPTPNY